MPKNAIESFLMRRFCPEPCLRDKVLWMLWESMLFEFVLWLCHWFFLLAQMHGFPGTDMCLLILRCPWLLCFIQVVFETVT